MGGKYGRNAGKLYFLIFVSYAYLSYIFMANDDWDPIPQSYLSFPLFDRIESGRREEEYRGKHKNINLLLENAGRCIVLIIVRARNIVHCPFIAGFSRGASEIRVIGGVGGGGGVEMIIQSVTSSQYGRYREFIMV